MKRAKRRIVVEQEEEDKIEKTKLTESRNNRSKIMRSKKRMIR